MDHAELPEWYRALDHAPLDTKLGLEVLELAPRRVVGRIPVEGNQQPFGLLHGGATAVLVETLGSLGAVAHGQPTHGAVGVDINVTHLRATRSGWVTGTATAVHLGRSTAVYQVDIADDGGRTIAVGRITCRLVPIG